jgi:hypothetical protein
VAHFCQANFELHPFDVEKWAASRWNHQQLKIGLWQLDLWHRLKMKNVSVLCWSKCNHALRMDIDHLCMYWVLLIQEYTNEE